MDRANPTGDDSLMVDFQVTGPNRDIPVWSLSVEDVAMYHAVNHAHEYCWCEGSTESDFLKDAAKRFSRAAGVPVFPAGVALQVVGPEMPPPPLGCRHHDLRELFRPLYEAFTSSSAR